MPGAIRQPDRQATLRAQMLNISYRCHYFTANVVPVQYGTFRAKDTLLECTHPVLRSGTPLIFFRIGILEFRVIVRCHALESNRWRSFAAGGAWTFLSARRAGYFGGFVPN